MIRLLIASSILLIVGCQAIQIQNARTCAVAGLLERGSICSRLTTSDTNILSFNETIDMFLAQPERSCVPVGHWGVPPAKKSWKMDFNICADDQTNGTVMSLPARGAAIFMPSADFGTIATELELMCREKGKNCTYETKKLIAGMKAQLK